MQLREQVEPLNCPKTTPVNEGNLYHGFYVTMRIWHWKSHWIARITQQIERTKDMNNAENFSVSFSGIIRKQSCVIIADKCLCD